MNKKIFCFTLSVCLLFTSLTYSVDFSKIEKDILTIEYFEIQIAAVENDMKFFLGWEPVEKAEWGEPAMKAIADLNNIKGRLQKLRISEELKTLKKQCLSLIESLKIVYKGIENKPDEIIRSDLEKFWEIVKPYNKNIEDKIEKYLKFPDFPDEFSYQIEEEKLFKNKEDKEKFKEINMLIDKKHYPWAFKKSKLLLQKYKDTPAEAVILTRFVEANQKFEDQQFEKTEENILQLNKLLDKKNYYPNLYLIFLQWRTLDQYYNHGSSNWSEIPNDKYIKKRWQVANTIMNYMSKNPDDKWAKVQLIFLMDLPIIKRGGDYGNSNMFHWGGLFTDILDKDEDKDK
ncbi:MAG: hypothetical protein K9L76_00195 [Candidatus Omnitrophica bacterium]|nr:hypothetical protein [Candidatus Omnitrophota bacterium]